MSNGYAWLWYRLCIPLLCAAVLVIAGCSSSSDSAPPDTTPPAPDTTPPTVTLVSPGDGATVSRVVTLEADASDDVGVTQVRFLVDGEVVGSVSGPSDHSLEWDSATVSDGEVTLSAEAEDAAGNVGTSADIQVTVSNERSFAATGSGAQEVPAVDTGATGTVEFDINIGTGAVSGAVVVEGMEPTEAHIHDAFAGANGPILIHLDQDPADPMRFEAPPNAALTASQVDRLLAGGLYVNVHSDAHPPGEVRAQLLPAGMSLLFADLSGQQQVPAQDTTATGRAAITLDEFEPSAVVHLTLFSLGNAVAVDLHEGYAGTTGPLLDELVQSTTDVAHWFNDGLALDEDMLDALRAGRLYLNVVSDSFPDGQIRGQVIPDGIALLVDTLSGRQEVPPIDTNATGVSALTLDLDTLEFQFHVNTTGLDNNASAAHIHDGFTGTNGPVVVPLQQDTQNPARWSASGTLDTPDVDTLLAGGLYVNVHSFDHPDGEIRAQLVPDGIEVVFAVMDGDQVVPPVLTPATGLAAVTVNRNTGGVVAHVRVSDLLVPTSGGIHRAPMGENGPEVIALQQDTGDVNHWFATDGLLEEGDLDAYLQDRLYALIGSVTHPDGEVRGQLVREAVPMPDTEAPTATITEPPDGALVSGTITVSATASDNIGVVEVRFLANGQPIGSATAEPYSVQWDTTEVADGQIALTAEAEDAAGNVGVSAAVTVTVDNAVISMTLAEIQAQVFSPICSVCHTGVGGELPGSMNLTTASASFNHLVNVPSEQVALLRVNPGNPDDSYLIHKLEGTQAFGDQMPQGGPFLDAETIQGIRQWIADGAPEAPGAPPQQPIPGY